MKRKIILSLIVAALSLNLVACSNAKEDTSNTESSSTENISVELDDVQEEETKKEEANDKVVSNTTDAKESSLSSPLEIGETGITSRYSTVSGEYHDAYISLTNIIRGDETQKILDEYNKLDMLYTFDELESSLLEYAIGEYSITIPPDFPSDEYGPDENISSEIVGKNDESLKYDGVLYIISTWNIPMEGYETTVLKPGVPVNGRVVFSIPKGCTDYTVILGDDDTRAYFNGK